MEIDKLKENYIVINISDKEVSIQCKYCKCEGHYKLEDLEERDIDHFLTNAGYKCPQLKEVEDKLEEELKEIN